MSSATAAAPGATPRQLPPIVHAIGQLFHFSFIVILVEHIFHCTQLLVCLSHVINGYMVHLIL